MVIMWTVFREDRFEFVFPVYETTDGWFEAGDLTSL
jgi:hypothetical protein